MDNDSIKDNIFRLRKLRGFTQTEVARRCGISMTHYRNLESGSACLINPILPRLAEVLDIWSGFLLFGSWNREDKRFHLEEEAADYGCGSDAFTCGDNAESAVAGSPSGRSERKFIALRSEYETRIDKIVGENNSLRQVVETQKRDISHLESIIRMLRRLKGVED